MADTSNSADLPRSDLKSHAKGYSKFINVFKWGSVVVFVIAAVVVYLIAN